MKIRGLRTVARTREEPYQYMARLYRKWYLITYHAEKSSKYLGWRICQERLDYK